MIQIPNTDGTETDSNGSNIDDAYQLLLDNGAATGSDVPFANYGNTDMDYLSWVYNQPSVWRDAISYRMQSMQVIQNTDSAAGILKIKQALDDGYVLNFGTNIADSAVPYNMLWKFTTIANDANPGADNSFVGQQACSYVATPQAPYTDEGHAMTIVGYNDNVWVDVNGNGKVDPGETGAFLIANQWGKSWGNSGFTWLSYDALLDQSAVTNGPNANRQTAFQGDEVYYMTARASYTPTLLANFTIQPRIDGTWR